MIKIKVEVKQFNSIQYVELSSHQKGTNILQLLFNKLDFNQEIRKSIQSTLKVENVEVDVNKTINELEINNYSIIEVVLSKKITIECDHQHLGSIKYPTDAFASVNQFRNYLITELIKIKSCEIVIINSLNGTQLGSEAWGKYGIFQNIKVGLLFTKQQKIKYNDINKEIKIDILKIDIFQPISKILRQFMNASNITDDIIALKPNDEYINPDEVYKNLNLPPEQLWNLVIKKEFIFRISLEQQGIKEISIGKDKDVFDLIRIVRQAFKIEKTIPLMLEYKLTNYILDINNTVKQECILSYSHLNLIREASDNKINILLFNQHTLNKCIERVDVSQTLADLDRFIHHDKHTQRISYYVDDQVKVRTFNLKQLDLKSESIIEYKIEENQGENQEENQGETQCQSSSNLCPEQQNVHEASDELLTLIFENKYTNKSQQITSSPSTSVSEALKEVIKNEPIKEPGFYHVYLNNEKIDIKSRLDCLNMNNNKKLIYFTDLFNFQAFVEQEVYTLQVDQNLTLSQIEQQFRKQHKIDQQLSLYLINSQSKNEPLRQFLIKNQNYKFEFKKQQETIEYQKTQIKQLEFSILFQQLGQQYQIHANQEGICQSLFETIKRRFNLAKNQVIQMFVGDRLVDQNETIISLKNLVNQTQKQLTVEFIYHLDLVFENSSSKQQTKVQAQLEDQLEKVLLQNNINGSAYQYQSKLLDVKKIIKDLPIENNAKIEYQNEYKTKKLMIFENKRTGQLYKIEVEPEDSLKTLVDRLGVMINKIYYKNEILEWSMQIKNIDLNSGENIMFDELEQLEPLHEPSENLSQIIKVIVLIGERKLIYNANLSSNFGILKKIVFNQLIKDQGVEIDKYALMYNEKKLEDSKQISSLGKDQQVELQFQLIHEINSDKNKLIS